MSATQRCEAVTAIDLRQAERVYQHAAAKAEAAREARNAVVRAALAEGWTHARISEATGLTRGRIGQIALASKNSSPPP